MNEEEIYLLVADALAIKANLPVEKRDAQTGSKIIKTILELNHHIDLMGNNLMGNNKNEHYYNLVECCYTYYRLFDDYIQ